MQARGTFRLSRSFDGSSILVLEDSKAGDQTARVYDSSSSRNNGGLRVTERALRVAGGFDGSTPLISQSPGKMRFSPDGGATWRTTIEGSFASVTAAPDFQTSQTALAGGFRAGIYRSTTGGAVWEEALPNPSSVVPGSNEISRIEFMSVTDVVAVNGGTFIWQDF
jgi:hypothetical protein